MDGLLLREMTVLLPKSKQNIAYIKQCLKHRQEILQIKCLFGAILCLVNNRLEDYNLKFDFFESPTYSSTNKCLNNYKTKYDKLYRRHIPREIKLDPNSVLYRKDRSDT